MAEKNIKTVTETTHIVNAAGETINKRITYLQQRDEQGNVMLDASWQSNGMLENKTTYAYNEANQMTAQKIYLDEENISEHWTYTYNEEGDVIEKAVEYADGSHSYYTKNIAEDGAIVWEISDEDQEFEGKEIRVFNNNKLLVSSVDIDDENTETLRKEFVYDDKDNVIEQRVYEYENLSATEAMQYDDQGNLIRTINLSPGGNKISDIQYTYNTENKVAFYDVNQEVRTAFIYDSQMGAQYEVEPGVMGRSSAVHQKVTFAYEYW